MKSPWCFALCSLLVCCAWLVLAAAPAVGLAADPGHAAAEGSHDAHAAHGNHGGTDPSDPLTVNPDLAIVTLVIFILLFIVLKKFAWGPIAVALDGREQKIADAIAAADEAQVEARKLLVEYESKLASAHEEVRSIIEEARRDAQHTQQEILAKAQAEAQLEVERGRREIETARDQALSELANAAANHAVDLAGKVLRRKLDPTDHAALVQEALASMPSGKGL